jgi:hypothetical protein
MTDKDRQQPRVSPAGARREEARQDRLAQALRENLTKRKAQSRARGRARDASGAAAPAGPGDPSPAADRDSNR